MQIRATPPATMLAAHRRAAPAPPPPAPVNRDAVLQLFHPTPLRWDGVEYSVRPITYPEGLDLERLQLALQATELDEVAIASRLAAYESARNLFWSFLSPQPAENPFSDLLPEEVGALLGFFCACRTRPNAPSRFQMGRPHPSTT